jgi:hypothetical protein
LRAKKPGRTCHLSRKYPPAPPGSKRNKEIPEVESRLNLDSEVELGLSFRIQDSRFKIQNSKFQITSTKSKIKN